MSSRFLAGWFQWFCDVCTNALAIKSVTLKGGVQKFQKLCDVINGQPLNETMKKTVIVVSLSLILGKD